MALNIVDKMNRLIPQLRVGITLILKSLEFKLRFIRFQIEIQIEIFNRLMANRV